MEKHQLVTDDGAELVAHLWEPVERAEMTVLALPGIGVPQRLFRHISAWLAERKARTVSIDYRGMSDSKGGAPGRHPPSLTTWARRDAPAALDWIVASWPEPVVLLGHSFGGQMLGLSESLHRVRAAALIASQFGQARYWDGLARFKIAAYWRIILPLSTAVFDVVPGWTGLGAPLPREAARQWALWGRSSEWYVSHEKGAAELLRDFARPLLAYSISDDRIAPPRAVTAFLQRFGSTAPVRRDVFPGELGRDSIGHLGLLRPDAPEAVWMEILAFFQSHVGAGTRPES